MLQSQTWETLQTVLAPLQIWEVAAEEKLGMLLVWQWIKRGVLVSSCLVLVTAKWTWTHVSTSLWVVNTVSARDCSQLRGSESSVVGVKKEDWQNVERRSHRSKGNCSSWEILEKTMGPFNLRNNGLIWANLTSSFCHEETALQNKKCQFVLTELLLGYTQILSSQKLQIKAVLATGR